MNFSEKYGFTMKPHSFFLVFVCSIKELKSTIQNKFKGDRMQVTLQNVWVTFRNIQSLGSLCRIKNIFKIIAFILFPLISLQVHSANTVQTTGYISKIRTFTSGTATYNTNDIGITNIYVDSLAGACGSNEKRVAISTDHALYESVISMALMAKASNLEIEIWHLGTCTIRSNSWDFRLIELQ